MSDMRGVGLLLLAVGCARGAASVSLDGAAGGPGAIDGAAGPEAATLSAGAAQHQLLRRGVPRRSLVHAAFSGEAFGAVVLETAAARARLLGSTLLLDPRTSFGVARVGSDGLPGGFTWTDLDDFSQSAQVVAVA